MKKETFQNLEENLSLAINNIVLMEQEKIREIFQDWKVYHVVRNKHDRQCGIILGFGKTSKAKKDRLVYLHCFSLKKKTSFKWDHWEYIG